jgi:tetratricopeptide (TPR) repeat protein
LKEISDDVITADTFLHCGDDARAGKIADEFARRPGTSTDIVSLARGLSALSKHQPQEAIEALEPLRGLARMTTERNTLLRSQTDIPLLRGLAYMELKRHAEAAEEFRKLIELKSQLLNTDYAAAHVYLARALAAAGKTEEAKETYDAFFALWKNADAGIPLLEAARKEYSAL